VITDPSTIGPDTPAQDVYDFVVRHLLRQGRPSVEHPGTLSSRCLYRSPDGLKCAVGCLLTDEEATPAIEGFRAVEILPGRLRAHVDLLCDLQSAHDALNCGRWPDLPARLRYTAIAHNLSPAVLDEVPPCPA
jgi:hypothetical protein